MYLFLFQQLTILFTI